RCLRVRAEDRPQTMAAMREAIGLAPVAEAAAAMPAFAPSPTIDPSTVAAASQRSSAADVSMPDIALPDRTELVARTVVAAPPPAPRLASLDAAIDAARAAADPGLAPTLEAPPAAPLGGELSLAVKSGAGGALQVFVWDPSTDRIHRLVPDDKGGAVPANGSATVRYRDKDAATRPAQAPLGRWRVVALLSDAPRDLSATAFARDGDAVVAARGALEARLAGEGLDGLIGK